MSADFDERAATWDDDPTKVERARVVADAICAAVAPDPTTSLLEYGAGTGLVSQFLRDRVGAVTLADTSAGMRQQMEQKVAAGVIADARVVDLDLSTDEVPDERYDLIVTVMVMHHITTLERVLGAFASMLHRGGRLCVVDLEKEDGSFHGEGFHGHEGFDLDDLAAQLRAAGFAGVDVTRVHEIERGDRTYPVFLAVAGV
jgi:predicted TPR repeat methyltransferase